MNFPADVEPSSPKTLEYFEAKIDELKRTGETPIKAMILCNPNNPLGFIYPRETILAYCRFAEKHNIHLSVDCLIIAGPLLNIHRPSASWTRFTHSRYTRIVVGDPAHMALLRTLT